MLWGGGGVTECSCSSSFGDLKCPKESAQSASAIIWQRKQGFAFTKVFFFPLVTVFLWRPVSDFFDRRCLNLDREQTRLYVFTKTWIIHARKGALTHITHPRVVVWPFDTFIGQLVAFFHSLSPKRWVCSDASALQPWKAKTSVWNCWSHLSDFAVRNDGGKPPPLPAFIFTLMSSFWCQNMWSSDAAFTVRMNLAGICATFAKWAL